MSWLSSHWTTLFVVAAFVTACLVAEPVTDAARGDAGADPSQGTAQGRAIEAARQATAVRLELKNLLLHELIADRMTLPEVAERFTELNKDCPLYEELIHRSVPGHTAEERMARNVLEHLRGFPIPPQQCEAVRARLRRQFEDRFGYPLD
jgi:hypothetical protein